MGALAIILILRAQIRMSRDNSPLGTNEILVDWLDDLKACLIELKKATLDSNTPNLYLGLLGEFALSRWLEARGISFEPPETGYCSGEAQTNESQASKPSRTSDSW